ncbi:MAG: bifunctional phosphopantothenoylcysteine decarboxylase/phosphopantothenate--cysteine ligase CoaBC [Clostridia bacterium]|nr:bifunctional phosphopantothenoylcysteine decarboxylase/phosphopantothenate--cysteine ligase CoaBC [Clostridia bacterium]
MLKNKNIVIGITGGIAAYKACDIVSYLQKQEANINVIMTKNATKFISPITLETLSKNKVITDMFESPSHFDVKHISLAKKADLFLIVPATANIIGKVANGIADDMLSTTIMATRKKVIFAPAMNQQMYENPIVQENIRKLKKYGYTFIEPEVGILACGDTAIGKLASKETIIDTVLEILKEEN